MKHRYICLVALLAVLCVYGAGPAEAFLPGVPSFGQWCCPPGQKPACAVDGKLGYLGYPRAFVLDFTAVGPGLGVPPLPNFGFEFPVEGIWVGASAATGRARGSFSSCDPGDPLCLSLAASWLFPNNKEGTARYFQDFGPTASVNIFRSWRPSIQWYTLDAAVLRCRGTTFSLIGGFRYDSFMIKLADPSTLVLGTVADEGELKLSSYIPYVGGVARWGGVEVGLMGFPWVPGTILYKETFAAARAEAIANYRNSYFFEAFLDVGRQMGVVHLSAFATYTVLHATGEADVSLSNVPLSRPYSFGFDRQNWIVGGKVVIGLNSPL